MAWLNFRQSGILADRYFDILLGDLRNTLLLLLQSPIIAGFIILKWKGVEQVTNTLYFVLALSALWFGCSNACREIVKEQAIFFRERMIGIEVPAYVFSKVRILAMLGFVQCLGLIILVNYYVHLLGNKLLLFLTVFLCSLSGTAMGLLVSAIFNSQDKAVGIVPILMIPQILFSEFMLFKEASGGAAEYIEDVMMVNWGYESFKQIIAAEPNYLLIARNFLVLGIFSGLFVVLTVLMLKQKKP